jgi:hypothetical protein
MTKHSGESIVDDVRWVLRHCKFATDTTKKGKVEYVVGNETDEETLSLPIRTEAGKRLAAIPEGPGDDKVPDYIRFGHKHEAEIEAAIALIKSKLNEVEIAMVRTPSSDGPFVITWVLQDIAKLAQKASDAAQRMEEERRNQDVPRTNTTDDVV